MFHTRVEIERLTAGGLAHFDSEDEVGVDVFLRIPRRCGGVALADGVPFEVLDGLVVEMEGLELEA